MEVRHPDHPGRNQVARVVEPERCRLGREQPRGNCDERGDPDRAPDHATGHGSNRLGGPRDSEKLPERGFPARVAGGVSWGRVPRPPIEGNPTSIEFVAPIGELRNGIHRSAGSFLAKRSPIYDLRVAAFDSEFRECLELVLGAPAPVPEYEASRFYRQWLAERNLGLVPIASPATFDWAGHWLARVRTSDGEHAVVMFGAPPGPLHDPSGALASGGTIEDGWLIARLDVQLSIEEP